MLVIVRELNDKEKQFISGFVNGGSQAASWTASLKDEKLVNFINKIEDLLSAENFSDNLLDMLHTARLDGSISQKQVEWLQRELKDRCK